MSGVVKNIGKAVTKFFGGGTSAKIQLPEVPDYEAERLQVEENAVKERSRLAGLGMSGTILGGSVGDSKSVHKKKLLGE